MRVIVIDEIAILLVRGKLWKANPKSVRSMKQGSRAFEGVNR
jgi:hypothetical protein